MFIVIGAELIKVNMKAIAKLRDWKGVARPSWDLPCAFKLDTSLRIKCAIELLKLFPIRKILYPNKHGYCF